MKREITLLILGMVMSCVLAACGNANTGKDETEKAKTSEVVEEVEINKDILAVAEENAQFDNEAIIERANNRMKTEPEFYSGSKVPKIDSCVTGIVYDTTNSGDGNYIYYFGSILHCFAVFTQNWGQTRICASISLVVMPLAYIDRIFSSIS